MKCYTTTPIKHMNKSLRPRERLQKYGVDYIELYELIAIIIRSGTSQSSALDIGKKVVDVLESKYYNNVVIEDLVTIPGVSRIKATEIVAALEIGNRIVSMKSDFDISIQEPSDCLPYLNEIRSAKKEHFMALYLNTKNKLINKEVISIGTLNASLVHPREVFEPAYRYASARVILAHNHPSGDTSPSQEDISVTKELVSAGSILGIQILDHVVVSHNDFHSLQQSNPELFE